MLTGCETFEEWVERGPIFHETFIKSADNLATRLHVVANYNSINTTAAFLLSLIIQELSQDHQA